MTALADRVVELLGSHGVRTGRTEDDRVVLVLGDADEDGWPVALVAFEEPHEAVVVHALAPVSCPPERRAALAELVTRANLGLAVGCLELDLDDGELRVRAGVRLGGGQLTMELLGGVLGEVAELVEVYGPAAVDAMRP